MLFNLIKNNKFILIFIIIHIIFFNINYAEWGDSYRILRASEFIRSFSYPDDEKRQPLYSMFLAIRPAFADQIFWGRLLMFGVSIFSFVIFLKILNFYNLDNKTKYLAQILFIFNPVILYWSIRIMADMFFTMLVLLSFYIYLKYKNKLRIKHLILLGILSTLGILTRFEGYILTFCLGAAIVYEEYINGKKYSEIITKFLIYFFSLSILLIPWLMYRNPLTSKYFEETSGRSYDLTMLEIYFSSLLFLFGFTSAGFFLIKKIKDISVAVRKNLGIFLFITLELILALIWPAAIPRLLVPIIPFLIILLSNSISKHFSHPSKIKMFDVFILLILFFSYIIFQYFLKLQFLVPIKLFFIFIIFIQAVNIFSIYEKYFRLFMISLILSLVIWSTSTIILHKDIFKAIVEANRFAVNNLHGRIAYNDVSSISDWYMNQSSKNDSISGFYLNMDSKKNRSYENLLNNNVDYILITNEHNPTLEFNSNESSYLSQVKEFSYTIRGKKFFTKILKFEE